MEWYLRGCELCFACFHWLVVICKGLRDTILIHYLLGIYTCSIMRGIFEVLVVRFLEGYEDARLFDWLIFSDFLFSLVVSVLPLGSRPHAHAHILCCSARSE